MKKEKSFFQSFLLDAQAIDVCSDQVRSFLKEQKVPRREITRYSLTIEELLLNSLEAGGDGITASLDLRVRFFRPTITLSIEGEAFNAYRREDPEGSVLGNSFLNGMGLSPEYSYRGHTNRYQFRVRRQGMNLYAKMLLVFLASVLIGFGGLQFPRETLNKLTSGFIVPVHDTFMNVISCIAGPMVFLSVAWGIYGIGDAATLKRVGKRVLLKYILYVVVIVVLLGASFLPLFNLQFVNGESHLEQSGSILTMLLGIFPSNFFSPFVDGNTLQIIFLAAIVGIAMLLLGEKTDSVAKAVEQINLIVQLLIEFISKLVPFFIGFTVVQMIWSDLFSSFVSIWKMALLTVLACMMMCLFVIGYTAFRNRVNPFLLIRKGLPTLLLALTTASSAAAFSTNMSACKEEYGIDESLASFGMPLGIVMYKPSYGMTLLLASLFFAEVFSVEVSGMWIVTLFLLSIVLSIATPPIPGGGLAVYLVLFSQLGIPGEAVALALAAESILDFVATGCDQFLLPLALLNEASALGMVDREKLICGTEKKENPS